MNKNTFNVNNQGSVIKAREQIQGQSSTSIAIAAVHLILLIVLYLLAFVFLSSPDDYSNVLLYLFGLAGVFGLLFTAISVRRETRPKSVGELDAAQTLGLITIVALVIGVVLAFIAFIYESSSSASFSIYIWGIVWGVGLTLALVWSVIVYLGILRYRSKYERTLRDECRRKLVPSTVATELPITAPMRPVWLESNSASA
jgi:hypothetical protein